MISDYPVLSLGQIYSALAYYHDHKNEIDPYFEERDRSTDDIRAHQGLSPQRARLLAAKRKKAREPA